MAHWQIDVDRDRREGRHGRAAELAFAHYRDGQSPDAAIALARIHFELAFHREAFAWAKAAIDHSPPDAADLEWTNALAAWAAALSATEEQPTLTDPVVQRWAERMRLDGNVVASQTANAEGASPEPCEPDRSEPPELIIAGLRQHRLLNIGREVPAVLRAAARHYAATVTEPAFLAEFDAQYAGRYDSVLAVMPFPDQLRFYAARLWLGMREPELALGFAKELWEAPHLRHVVPVKTLAVQVTRDLALPLADRNARLDEADAAVAAADGFVPFMPTGEGGPSTGRPVPFRSRRLFIGRHRALVQSLTDPCQAYRTCRRADEESNEGLAYEGRGWTQHSYSRLAFLTRCPNPPEEADLGQEVASLLPNLGLDPATVHCFTLHPPPDSEQAAAPGPTTETGERLRTTAGADPDSSPDSNPLRNDPYGVHERALHTVVDAIAATGQADRALELTREIHRWEPRSGASAGALIARLERAGRYREAEEVGAAFEASGSIDRPNLVHLALGRVRLATGHHEQARDCFEEAADSFWAEEAAEGWIGQIDWARRNRNIGRAAQLAARATKRFDGCDVHIRSQLWIAHGWAQIQLGSPRYGFALLRRALLHRPNDVGAWTGLVRSCRMLGKHDLALGICRGLLGLPSEQTNLDWENEQLRARPIAPRFRPRVACEYGWALNDIGHHHEALSQFRAALDAYPLLGAAHRGLLASSSNDQHTLANAENSCARLIEAHHYRLDLRRDIALEAGRGYLLLGNLDEARRRFATVSDLLVEPGHELAPGVVRRYLYAMADAYLEHRRVPEAEELLRRAERIASSPVAALDRASTGAQLAPDHGQAGNDERRIILEAKRDLVLGRSKRADRLLQDWRDRHPEVGEPLRAAHVVAAFEDRSFERADELNRDLGRYPDGLSDEWSRRCEAAPASEVRLLLDAWIKLASSELPSERDRARRLIGEAWAALRQTDQTAVEEVHLAAILHARTAGLDPRIRSNPGSALSQDPGRPGDPGRSQDPGLSEDASELESSLDIALQFMDKAIERAPNGAAYHRDRGAILRSMKRPDEAILAFDRAERIDPGDPRIYLLRGDSRYQLGDVDGAVADFQAAVTLDPDDYVHHRALTIAYLASGQLVEARKAVDHGIDRVKTARRSRLLLLQARVADRQARLAPRARRQRILQEALSRLQQREAATGHQMSSAERADFHARRAYLHLGLGERGAAKRLASSALDLDPEHEEALSIRDSLESDVAPVLTWSPWSKRAFAAAWCLGVGWFAALLVIRSLTMGSRELLVVVLFLLLAPLLLPSLPSLIARIGGINIAGLAVELKPNEPVEEQVHVDLDLSASEFLRVSGFSSHRPMVSLVQLEEVGVRVREV